MLREKREYNPPFQFTHAASSMNQDEFLNAQETPRMGNDNKVEI